MAIQPCYLRTHSDIMSRRRVQERQYRGAFPCVNIVMTSSNIIRVPCVLLVILLPLIDGTPINSLKLRRGLQDNQVETVLEDATSLYNYSYEVRCVPKAKLVVDGFTINVNTDMKLVLRFICLFARTLNTNGESRDSVSFGFISSNEAANIIDYVSNTTNKTFGVIYQYEKNGNSTDLHTYGALTHGCEAVPFGHSFRLGDRLLKVWSVAWRLLDTVACPNGDWPPAQADGAEENGDEDEQRDKRGTTNNEVDDDNRTNTEAVSDEIYSSNNHSYNVSCTRDTEMLMLDDFEVQITQHMRSAIRLLCSSLPDIDDGNATTFRFGYISTEESFNTQDYILNSTANKRLDVLYEDGQTRDSQNLYTFYGRCQPEPMGPVFSVVGHILKARSIMWSLFSLTQCKGPPATSGPPAEEQADQPEAFAQKAHHLLVMSEQSARGKKAVHCRKDDETKENGNIRGSNHTYDLRCKKESEALIVDCIKVKITDHMKAALQFLCNIIKMNGTVSHKTQLYRFGYIATRTSFRTKDYALDSGNNTLDVEYEGGLRDSSINLTAFGQMCRWGAVLDHDFSLDKGSLLPRSIMWGLFSKVRCLERDDEDLDLAMNRELEPDYFTNHHLDFSMENFTAIYGVNSIEEIPVEEPRSSNHSFEIRCSLGSEGLIADSVELAVTDHLHAALGFLCFSSGLHEGTYRLGYIKTVEHFNTEDYTLNATNRRSLDVLYFDGISRGDMRVFSMMPNCQSQPPKFELNGIEIKYNSLVWILYKMLACETQKVMRDAVLNTTTEATLVTHTSFYKKDSTTAPGSTMSTTVKSNVHNYGIRCKCPTNKLLVDDLMVKVTPHMHQVLQFLCTIMDVYLKHSKDNSTYSFGYITTSESFNTADYSTNSTLDNRFDVLYSNPNKVRNKQPLNLRVGCQPDPPGNFFILDGRRLQSHSIVWSLFSKVRCSEIPQYYR